MNTSNKLMNVIGDINESKQTLKVCSDYKKVKKKILGTYGLETYDGIIYDVGYPSEETAERRLQGRSKILGGLEGKQKVVYIDPDADIEWV